MRKLIAVCAAAILLGAGAAAVAGVLPGHIAAAVATSTRPDTDRARDLNRRPGDVLAFTGVRKGDVVVDFWPGGGYFTRLFSPAVGPRGKVFAVSPQELVDKFGDRAKAGMERLKADPNTRNVTGLFVPVAQFSVGQPVDIVFTMQNYHDLHAKFMEGTDVAAYNRAVFASLKPGGLYIVGDHAAAPGSDVSTSETLHRIDPAIVRREVEAAGFEYIGSLDVLRRSDDPHTARIFEESIHDKTDRFILKFRKPRR
jgi:predicted methyltransferase